MDPETKLIKVPEIGFYRLQEAAEFDYSWRFWAERSTYRRVEGLTQWYWARIYQDWLDVVRERREHPHCWIDLGCGNGHLVKFLRDQGIKAWGMDLAAGQSGADVIMDAEKPSIRPYALKMSGVISMNFLLEHVRDPVALLAECNLLLRPGGLILIQVPNEFNPLQRELTEQYGSWWVHPTHLNYFDTESLLRLLNIQGFRILKLEYSFPMEYFVYLGLNYLRFPKLGLICHFIRMLLELPSGLRKRIRDFCRERKIGRDLWILGVAVTWPSYKNLEELLCSNRL